MKENEFVFDLGNVKYLELGRTVALSLSIITIITFLFAMIAVPISGANAPNGGIPYPYLDTIKQYPKDFIWQYLALLQIVFYLTFFVILKQTISKRNALLTAISHAFAIMASLILLVTYYTQVMVIPSSLTSGETNGLALLIQYNPHGVFIALEELGYILMLLSFTVIAGAFDTKEKSSAWIKTLTYISFVLCILSFIIICLLFGIDKKDRFEVIIISLVWLMTIVNGFIIASIFQKHIGTSKELA